VFFGNILMVLKRYLYIFQSALVRQFLPLCMVAIHGTGPLRIFTGLIAKNIKNILSFRLSETLGTGFIQHFFMLKKM